MHEYDELFGSVGCVRSLSLVGGEDVSFPRLFCVLCWKTTCIVIADTYYFPALGPKSYCTTVKGYYHLSLCVHRYYLLYHAHIHESYAVFSFLSSIMIRKNVILQVLSSFLRGLSICGTYMVIFFLLFYNNSLGPSRAEMYT